MGMSDVPVEVPGEVRRPRAAGPGGSGSRGM